MIFAIDTNVLIYAVGSGDHRNASARIVVSRAFVCNAIVPVQVLAEFHNACRRKNVLQPEMVTQRTSEWSRLFQLPQTSFDDLLVAARLMQRHGLSYFDALIAAIARRAGATTLLSEDMQDGAVYEGLQIVNPFNPANTDLTETLLATSA